MLAIIKAEITFHNGYLFLLKVFYILVWTWLLNKFCDWGFTPLSWLLVLWRHYYYSLYTNRIVYV